MRRSGAFGTTSEVMTVMVTESLFFQKTMHPGRNGHGQIVSHLNIRSMQSLTSCVPGIIIFPHTQSLVMVGISTYCLLDRPLPEALDRLSSITNLIEVVDEGPHFVHDASLFGSYSADFVFHAPYHGMNIASLFEAIRTASVKVMTDCFSVAAEVGAGVVMHRDILPGNRSVCRPTGSSKSPCTSSCYAARELSLTFWFENMGDMNFFNLRTPAHLDRIEGCGFALNTAMHTSITASRIPADPVFPYAYPR